MTNQTITLPDGRSLGYAEYGDLTGKPLFHFHGYPGSRFEAGLAAKEVKSAGIRLIGIDRPGIGLSDFQPNRQILDWPDDVVALADALGIEHFAVQGVSGGGAYAAACAYKIPNRLTACNIISGLGPDVFSNDDMSFSLRLNFFLARWLPSLLRLLFWGMFSRHKQDIDKLDALILKSLETMEGPDRNLLQSQALRKLFAASTAEAFRQGTKGIVYEGKLHAQPWGFNLEDISFDNIHLWHGELDTNVPISSGRAVAKAIPNCKATYYPDDAHLSIIFNHLDEIVATIV